MAFIVAAPAAQYYWNADSVPFAIGQVIFQSSIGQTQRAVASSTTSGTANAVGVVLDTSAAVGAQFRAVSSGAVSATTAQWDSVTGQVGGLTPGAAYYLSPTTLGGLTSTPPIALTQYLVYIGRADSSTALDVSIDAAAGPVGGPVAPPLTSRDATSLKLVPATALEYDTLLGACGISRGGPASIYLMQDANTQATDVNGKHHLVPTVVGAAFATFANTLTGWTGKAIGVLNSGVDIGFVKQHGTLPDPATNSYLMLAYVQLTDYPPSGARGFLSCTDAAIYAAIASDGKIITGTASGQSSKGSVAVPTGQVFPCVLKHDIGRNTVKVYTPWEVITQVFVGSSSNTGEVDFGVAAASLIQTTNAFYRYGSLWTGTSAEMSDEQVGLLLQTMGWSIAWMTATTRGATSNVYHPLTSAQWQALDIAPATNAYSLQESNNIVANDVRNDCTLVAQAGVTLGNASSNERLALKTTDGTVSSYAGSVDARLGSPATTSQMALIYTTITGATTGVSTLWSWVFGFDSLQFVSCFCTTAGLLGIFQGSAGGVGTVDHRGAEHPILLMYDRTNQRSMLYTDKEKIAGPAYGSDANTAGLYIGSHTPSAPSVGQLATFFASWSGQAAELTDNQARAMLQKLGWTVSW